ncbi:MAG: (deoxy)nucleoside triphosphate pyrophosphohydrolase [Candidatus Sericytochromatia bacterium]|nr:(deoxy)nucleoside triphosphate pyrophosphohydrolase [Candidatus Sericytochromatia bacterium]
MDESGIAPPLPVVAAVIRRGDRVLLARRPLDKAQAGLWEFPGGKVGDGELPEAALVREIQEELDCTITVGAPLITVTHAYPALTITLSAYWATVFIGEPKVGEPLAIEWVPIAALADRELCAADRALAAACIKHAGAVSDPRTTVVWERGSDLD